MGVLSQEHLSCFAVIPMLPNVVFSGIARLLQNKVSSDMLRLIQHVGGIQMLLHSS